VMDFSMACNCSWTPFRLLRTAVNFFVRSLISIDPPARHSLKSQKKNINTTKKNGARDNSNYMRLVVSFNLAIWRAYELLGRLAASLENVLRQKGHVITPARHIFCNREKIPRIQNKSSNRLHDYL
jgi:hypothetical protein